jgi:hypothetical protein
MHVQQLCVAQAEKHRKASSSKAILTQDQTLSLTVAQNPHC